MYHSTSFCAAGSAILFLMSVASWVFALRARSMASFTSARSPVSGATALDGLLGSRRSLRRLRLALCGSVLGVPIFSGRSAAMGASLLRHAATSWSLRAPSGRVAYGWPARSHPSRREASPANVKKQDSERKHRFIPWSPCETHVTNTVKTKRSRDACGPELVRKLPQRRRCNCHVCTTNACKMRRMEPREFQRSAWNRLRPRTKPACPAFNIAADPAVCSGSKCVGAADAAARTSLPAKFRLEGFHSARRSLIGLRRSPDEPSALICGRAYLWRSGRLSFSSCRLSISAISARNFGHAAIGWLAVPCSCHLPRGGPTSERDAHQCCLVGSAIAPQARVRSCMSAAISGSSKFHAYRCAHAVLRDRYPAGTHKRTPAPGDE